MSRARVGRDQTGASLYFHTVAGRNGSGEGTIDKWTFSAREVRREVESKIFGRVLNACAGKTKLRHPEGGEIVRNDLNPEMEADYHLDVKEIDRHFQPRSFDVAVFDPPYDQSQSDEHYDGMHAGDINAARRSLASLIAPEGLLIEFGWNSVSVSQLRDVRGWIRKEIHLWQRGPNLHEVIMTVDRRTAGSLDFTSLVEGRDSQ